MSKALAAAGAGEEVRYLATVMASLDAMADSRLQEAAIEFVARAFCGATGRTDERLECFCCCRPWSRERVPVGLVMIEFLGVGDEVLFTGICEECSPDRALFDAALRRDFPESWLRDLPPIGEA
jgi:hypothetical protein